MEGDQSAAGCPRFDVCRLQKCTLTACNQCMWLMRRTIVLPTDGARASCYAVARRGGITSCHRLHRPAPVLLSQLLSAGQFSQKRLLPYWTVDQSYRVADRGNKAADVAAAALLHLEITRLLPAAPHLKVLKVGADVEVIIHAVRFVCLQPLREVALQLLQMLLWQEVGLGKHHLGVKRPHWASVPLAWWGFSHVFILHFIFRAAKVSRRDWWCQRI